ncbi:HNH endonuclease (plasmid) [Azospirillum argentinense]|uniref:Putative HNH nuclease YajD n=2 Tax=Azospirillum argentinense TaxID=2970906 RepID=A0A4D8PDL7_9PROT|nr:HNH endonuclease [Azospirillum argentinense]
MPMAPPVHRPPGWRPPAVAQREQTRQLGRETDRRRRDNPARALYKTARWRTLRAAQLAAHPLCQCEACDEGRRRITPATVVDHIRPHRGDEGLFFDPANLRSMAKPCHDRKTARDDGGFGRARA